MTHNKAGFPSDYEDEDNTIVIDGSEADVSDGTTDSTTTSTIEQAAPDTDTVDTSDSTNTTNTTGGGFADFNDVTDSNDGTTDTDTSTDTDSDKQTAASGTLRALSDDEAGDTNLQNDTIDDVGTPINRISSTETDGQVFAGDDDSRRRQDETVNIGTDEGGVTGSVNDENTLVGTSGDSTRLEDTEFELYASYPEEDTDTSTSDDSTEWDTTNTTDGTGGTDTTDTRTGDGPFTELGPGQTTETVRKWRNRNLPEWAAEIVSLAQERDVPLQPNILELRRESGLTESELERDYNRNDIPDAFENFQVGDPFRSGDADDETVNVGSGTADSSGQSEARSERLRDVIGGVGAGVAPPEGTNLTGSDGLSDAMRFGPESGGDMGGTALSAAVLGLVLAVVAIGGN